MKAQSADYIELQNLYKMKARNDFAQVVGKVRLLERELHRDSPVDEKEIEAFCRGAAFIRLIKGQHLQASMLSNSEERKNHMKSLYRELPMQDSLLPIHAAFTTYDLLMSELCSRDGEAPSNLAEIHVRVREHLAGKTEFPDQWGGLEGVDVKLCGEKIGPILAELVRAKGGELHNISALTGGMVAQEAIKVITKQYIPVDNICVFDGILSKTEVFRSHAEG